MPKTKLISFSIHNSANPRQFDQLGELDFVSETGIREAVGRLRREGVPVARKLIERAIRRGEVDRLIPQADEPASADSVAELTDLGELSDFRPLFTLRYPNDSRKSMPEVLAEAVGEPAGRFAVSMKSEVVAEIIEPSTRRLPFTLRRTSFCFDFPADDPPVFSPDSKYLAASKNQLVGGAMKVVRVADKAVILELDNILPRGAFAWRRDSRYLAVGDQGGVHIIDIANKRKITIDENNGILNSGLSIAWSGDGNYLGASCGQGRILIYDFEPIRVVLELGV